MRPSYNFIDLAENVMNMSEVSVTDQPSTTAVDSYELLDCLLLVAALEGRPTSAPAVTSGLPLEEGRLTPAIFNRAANRAGLASIMLTRELEQIPLEVLPAILLLENGKAVVASALDKATGLVFVTVPETQEKIQLDLDSLREVYSGYAFYLRPMQQFDSRTPKIHHSSGDHWFWGVLKSSSKIYRDVLVASFLINLFVLAQPLFVMNVYDRVVPNNALETLWALALVF
ncbi:MAG: hypothetical protein R3E57_03640 [Porticoccaceae bacterium]